MTMRWPTAALGACVSDGSCTKSATGTKLAACMSHRRVSRPRADARAFLSGVEADIRRGVWIDPWAGRLRVWELAEEWAASNPTKWESTTAPERS